VDRRQVHIQEIGREEKKGGNTSVGEETERNNIRKTRLSTGNGRGGERMKRQILALEYLMVVLLESNLASTGKSTIPKEGSAPTNDGDV
jgi:hypothetical protein